MSNLGIIEQFLQTFIRYIDSGFGLLNGDIVGLTSILIGIDITLAGLFWALDRDNDVLVKLIRKTLYVGTFAFIIGNFQNLSTIIFNSFATLGIQATGAGLSDGDLLLPGKLAGTGFQAAWPLLQQAGSLIGVTTFFTHFVTIAVLLLAWLVVIFAFFILAVQLFITVLEFKLTCLAGFTLVPFALWSRTAFLAERVLGNVISSGVKLMVLAVIIGIGSTLFGTFTSATQGQEPSLAGAMSLVLASITLWAWHFRTGDRDRIGVRGAAARGRRCRRDRGRAGGCGDADRRRGTGRRAPARCRRRRRVGSNSCGYGDGLGSFDRLSAWSRALSWLERARRLWGRWHRGRWWGPAKWSHATAACWRCDLGRNSCRAPVHWPGKRRRPAISSRRFASQRRCTRGA